MAAELNQRGWRAAGWYNTYARGMPRSITFSQRTRVTVQSTVRRRLVTNFLGPAFLQAFAICRRADLVIANVECTAPSYLKQSPLKNNFLGESISNTGEQKIKVIVPGQQLQLHQNFLNSSQATPLTVNQHTSWH